MSALFDADKQLARYTRDLLEYEEQLIKFGRDGFLFNDYASGAIIIDSLAPAQLYTKSKWYDSLAEEMHLIMSMSQAYTIDFYGDDSLLNAQTWALMQTSELGFSLQKTYGIAVYLTSGITDLKLLSGTQYTSRQEISFNVRFNVEKVIPTLRIESGKIEGIMAPPNTIEFETEIKQEA